MTDQEINTCAPVEISDDDVYEAMKEIPGYIDITPADFKEVYVKAYQQAIHRLTRSVKAKEIMNRDVAFVTENTPLVEVAKIMAARRISGVPVVDGDRKPVGIISEKDFLSVMGGGGPQTFMAVIYTCLACEDCLARTVQEKLARDIMTSPVITVALETSAMEIASLFSRKQINRAPVVDPNGCVVGIISRADVLRSSVIREEL
jgi:CBS domain-containing membrane protein